MFEEEWVSATVLTAVIFVALFLFSRTSIAEAITRKFSLKAREFSEAEHQLWDALLQEVYDKAKQQHPELSRDINFYMIDDDSINACAFGTSSVAIHTGLLKLYADEIAGIVGHELGHLAHKDVAHMMTASLLCNIAGIIISFGSILLKLFAILLGFIFKSTGVSDFTSMVTDWVCKAFSWIVNKIVGIYLFIIGVMMHLGSRQAELEADSFSGELGYADGMIQFFEQFPNADKSINKLSMEYFLHGTHPPMNERIANLRKYQTIKS